jgi:hypothetical protein
MLTFTLHSKKGGIHASINNYQLKNANWLMVLMKEFK